MIMIPVLIGFAVFVIGYRFGVRDERSRWLGSGDRHG